MNDSKDILQFIPQRYPFVMIDELLLADETKIISKFYIKGENILCENDFFSEAGLMENIAQTIAAGKGFLAQQQSKPATSGYIASVKNFEVFFLPKVNDSLTTEVIIGEQIMHIISVKGQVFNNNMLVAKCEMKIFANIDS